MKEMTEDEWLLHLQEQEFLSCNWYPIFGSYEINGLKQVRTTNFNRTGQVKILKTSKDSYGKEKINLSFEGKVKTYYIEDLYLFHYFIYN